MPPRNSTSCACVPPACAAGALALRDPLVDVRVAAWLSTPDDKRLKARQFCSAHCCTEQLPNSNTCLGQTQSSARVKEQCERCGLSHLLHPLCGSQLFPCLQDENACSVGGRQELFTLSSMLK